MITLSIRRLGFALSFVAEMGIVHACAYGAVIALECVQTHTESDMAESTTISVRLEPAVKERLEQLADATHRSKSFLAAEAIRAFVELNEWQVQEIQAALKEADAGDFAKPGDADKVRRKWQKA